MGSKSSYNDEWIELYNNTESVINLDGWKLIAENRGPQINLKGKIEASSFFLLERTDDESVPETSANFIYKGALSNEGEFLQLIDEKGNIIDEVDCSDGWFGGENSTKKTMERVNPKSAGSYKDNWQTSQNPGGTPRAPNSKGEKSEPVSQIAESDEVEPRHIDYVSGVLINEVLPSPKGPDVKKEYIEIVNKNDFVVNLSGWSLRDTKGKTKSFVFPKETKIEPRSFLAFFRPQTKITLNNSGDGLKLLTPDKEVADEVYYGKAPKGESFNRVGDNWFWSLNQTPGNENVVLLEKEKSKEETEKNSGIESRELIASMPEIIYQENLAKRIPKDFTFVFLIALSVALSSGILILALKRKIKSENY